MVTLPYVLAGLCEADFRLGNWTTAYARATESVALAEDTGQRSELAHSLVRLATVEAGRGRAEPCREHVERALEITDELGVGAVRTLGGRALGLLEPGVGRLEAAVDGLEETGRYSLERGLEEPVVAPWAQDLAEAHVRLGDRVSADRVLGILEEQAERTGGRGAAAAAFRCRGLLADDAAKAETLFRRALELHDKRPAPFERARTELCFGERLRRGGRRVDARRSLRSALDTLERLGARPWADKALRELRASGERARRRVGHEGEELTPQELQMALLVAEGATNREAAASLYLSPKRSRCTSRTPTASSRCALAPSSHGDWATLSLRRRPQRAAPNAV